MTSKSRKKKKVFPCGHRGFGTYCHYCEQKAKQSTLVDALEKSEGEKKDD